MKLKVLFRICMTIRQDLKGDFAEKVRQLDDLTKLLSAKQAKLDEVSPPGTKLDPNCHLLFTGVSFYGAGSCHPLLSSAA